MPVVCCAFVQAGWEATGDAAWLLIDMRWQSCEHMLLQDCQHWGSAEHAWMLHQACVHSWSVLKTVLERCCSASHAYWHPASFVSESDPTILLLRL